MYIYIYIYEYICYVVGFVIVGGFPPIPNPIFLFGGGRMSHFDFQMIDPNDRTEYDRRPLLRARHTRIHPPSLYTYTHTTRNEQTPRATKHNCFSFHLADPRV
jgi:hypothetical protein